MIFYFSATGNSKHVAESIASKGEELISIAEAMDKGQHLFSVADDRVGIVSPTYDWTLPSIVSELLAQLELRFEKKPISSMSRPMERPVAPLLPWQTASCVGKAFPSMPASISRCLTPGRRSSISLIMSMSAASSKAARRRLQR